MRVLITSAASDLASDLAKFTSREHQILLTDQAEVKGDFEFRRSDLGHTEDTNDLVRGMDAIIHLAEFSPNSSNRQQLDFLTRCTYNLLWAAIEEKVPRLIFSSTLQLFSKYDENLTVSENWRPLPSCDPYVLFKHLGEFVCREFAREGKINIVCLRLGNVVRPSQLKGKPFDPTWVDVEDAASAFNCALTSKVSNWSVFHINSGSSRARFSIAKAKSALGYNPKHNFEE